jgi:NAD+ kinase
MKNRARRAGIVIKPHAPGIEKILQDLVEYLKRKRVTPVLEDVAAKKLLRKGGVSRDDLPGQVDLVIVLGGDGTLLSVAHLAARAGVPVVGVNLGRLGFLTEVPTDELDVTLDAFLAGEEGIISPRLLLEARSRGKRYYCLNDVVVNKGAMARMIQIAIQINDREIAAIKSDGLVIATPTGSTAYSLSAGGPIVQPYVAALLLSPICPHTLSFRPMVVSSDSTIKLRLLTAGEEVYLTLDGQRGLLLGRNDIVEIRRAEFELSLVSSPRRNYFDLLKEKLGWAT